MLLNGHFQAPAGGLCDRRFASRSQISLLACMGILRLRHRCHNRIPRGWRLPLSRSGDRTIKQGATNCCVRHRSCHYLVAGSRLQPGIEHYLRGCFCSPIPSSFPHHQQSLNLHNQPTNQHLHLFNQIKHQSSCLPQISISQTKASSARSPTLSRTPPTTSPRLSRATLLRPARRPTRVRLHFLLTSN